MAKCLKCDGCGRVGDTDDQEPWSMWESLPPGSDVAVKMGLVRPMPCPECAGTREQADTEAGDGEG